MNKLFHTELAPGCHGDAVAPIVRPYKAWREALLAASHNDRLVAVDTTTGRRAILPEQGDPTLGAGRYGGRPSTKVRAAWIKVNL